VYWWDIRLDPALVARELLVDPPTLVVSVNHRFAKRKSIDPDKSRVSFMLQ
jgi:hypothetical protein